VVLEAFKAYVRLGNVMSVEPTRVEEARAFSAAGALCTKVRSQLNDATTLGELYFLTCHFRNTEMSIG
jgi:hypothetical protein